MNSLFGLSHDFCIFVFVRICKQQETAKPPSGYGRFLPQISLFANCWNWFVVCWRNGFNENSWNIEWFMKWSPYNWVVWFTSIYPKQPQPGALFASLLVVWWRCQCLTGRQKVPSWRWHPYHQNSKLASGKMKEFLGRPQTRRGPLTTISGFIPSYTHLQPWLNKVCWGYNYLVTRGAPSWSDSRRNFSFFTKQSEGRMSATVS